MKFWAVAYLYQEDVFWDFESNGDVVGIESTCFLPTEAIARGFIENQLNADYVPVEIELERLESNGSWAWNRGKIEHWDE